MGNGVGICRFRRHSSWAGRSSMRRAIVRCNASIARASIGLTWRQARRTSTGMKGKHAKLEGDRKGADSTARKWRVIQGEVRNIEADAAAAWAKYQSEASEVVHQCEAGIAELQGFVGGKYLQAGPDWDLENREVTIGVGVWEAKHTLSDVEKLSNVKRVYDGAAAAAWFKDRGSFIPDPPFPDSPFLVITLDVPQNADVGKNNDLGYTGDAPPSEAAVTPPLRMGDDLHQAVKKARAEAVERAKPDLATVRLSAAYEVLARQSDLTNPALSEDERLRRAGHLLTTYDRLRRRNPEFRDNSAQLRAARRIQKAAYRQRQRVKRGAGPAVRGRPRTKSLHI
jgi:hypothetical protein